MSEIKNGFIPSDASPVPPESVLPYPYKCFDEVNIEDSFSIKIGGTVYAVRTHFDPNGRQSVFQQFRSILLTD